jgi:hypothetical protein
MLIPRESPNGSVLGQLVPAGGLPTARMSEPDVTPGIWAA